MQDSHNQNGIRLSQIVDKMRAVPPGAKAGGDLISRPTDSRIPGKKIIQLIEAVDVRQGSISAPTAGALVRDIDQIGFRGW